MNTSYPKYQPSSKFNWCLMLIMRASWSKECLSKLIVFQHFLYNDSVNCQVSLVNSHSPQPQCSLSSQPQPPPLSLLLIVNSLSNTIQSDYMRSYQELWSDSQNYQGRYWILKSWVCEVQGYSGGHSTCCHSNHLTTQGRCRVEYTSTRQEWSCFLLWH